MAAPELLPCSRCASPQPFRLKGTQVRCARCGNVLMLKSALKERCTAYLTASVMTKVSAGAEKLVTGLHQQCLQSSSTEVS